MNNTFEYETDNNSIAVPNELLRAGLSAKAVGLYIQIADILSTGGRISASVVADGVTDGITGVESGLRELEEAGWLSRTKKKDSKGHFYSVYELKK